MIKTIIFISVLIITTGCNKKTSDVPLEEAFGIKFGEKYDVSTSFETINKNGIKMYRVFPPKNVSLYTNYYVAITPKTHKVSHVYATKILYGVNGFIQCLNEKKIVTELLMRKFGENSANSSRDGLSFIHPLNGFIWYDCKSEYGSAKEMFYIFYEHDAFSKLSKEEKIDFFESKSAL